MLSLIHSKNKQKPSSFTPRGQVTRYFNNSKKVLEMAQMNLLVTELSYLQVQLIKVVDFAKVIMFLSIGFVGH